MKSLLYYFIQAITCSGILYGYYHFFLRNKKFHVYNRFYLLIAAIISIMIPFLNVPVYFTANETNGSFVLKTITAISSGDFIEPVSTAPVPVKNRYFNAKGVAYCFYILISIIMLARILFSLERIRRIKRNYPVQKINSIYFVNTAEPGTPFSFFRWLFWNQKIELRSERGEQVFRHELFHIEQKHSLDIIYMELLTTIFWINPFLHLAKKEIKIIHEFLADKFAFNESKKWEYAELLLMQSLNTQHHLSNPFFYNQIKRRIAMITSSQKTSYQYLRKIMVLPVAAIVAALFAFSYKSKKEKNTFITLDKPVTVVIDAGHGVDAAGNHTGVTASDESHEDDIVLSIAKKIKELNTNDRLRIILTRENQTIVDLRKRVELANSQNADLLISLHINTASKEETNTKGIDILYSAKNTKYLAENKILATILYNYFHQIHSVNDITQPTKGVYVIDASHCPSVLVECGYLTDPNDLAFVKDESGQAQIAKSILQSIEQYFSQKEMSDWEQRKKTVSDTTRLVINFERNNLTGKMEGRYNGKRFKTMTDHDGQFAFVFDDDSATLVLISKEQTMALKKQYGKDLDELIRPNPQKRETEGKEQHELKELLEQKQLESEKTQTEFKGLMEEKQLEIEKQESELKEMPVLKKLETAKAHVDLKELIELKKRIDTLESKNEEEALKKLRRLTGEQSDTEKMQKLTELITRLKQPESDKTEDELEKLMLMKEKQMNPEELKKMLLEKQQQIDKSKTNKKKVKS